MPGKQLSGSLGTTTGVPIVSEISDDLNRLKQTVEGRTESEAERIQRSAPKGYEPGIVWEGTSGTLTTKPMETKLANYHDPGEWTELLKVWDLDPELYEVDPDINPQFRAWDANLGRDKVTGEPEVRRFYYYRATIRLKQDVWTLEDVTRLQEEIARDKPFTLDVTPDEKAFVVCLADWQIGKGKEGDTDGGVEATVKRITRMIELVEARIAQLRGSGQNIGVLYVMGMGDIVEACFGAYPKQTFTVEMNRRDQIKVSRRLVRDAVRRWAKMFPRVVVGAVAGNHGENRIARGESYTDDADNDDVALFESVAEIFSENKEAYGHVSFVIPDDKLYLVLDICGTRVGFAHGHKARKGSTPQQKQRNWWADMAFSETQLVDAQVLVTAHYHHYSYVDLGPKILLQCPSMDGHSKWFVDGGGGRSKSGTLTFVCGPDGVEDEKVLA